MDTGKEVDVTVLRGSEGLVDLKQRLLEAVQAIIRKAESDDDVTLREFEAQQWTLICLVYRLAVALFLASRHARLDVTAWKDDWEVRDGFAIRSIKTLCGAVRFGRVYLKPRRGKKP